MEKLSSIQWVLRDRQKRVRFEWFFLVDWKCFSCFSQEWKAINARTPPHTRRKVHSLAFLQHRFVVKSFNQTFAEWRCQIRRLPRTSSLASCKTYESFRSTFKVSRTLFGGVGVKEGTGRKLGFKTALETWRDFVALIETYAIKNAWRWLDLRRTMIENDGGVISGWIIEKLINKLWNFVLSERTYCFRWHFLLKVSEILRRSFYPHTSANDLNDAIIPCSLCFAWK